MIDTEDRMMMKGQLTFICFVWCIILSTVNYSPVNGRSLAQAQADGICHTDLLTATPDTNISDVTNIALGFSHASFLEIHKFRKCSSKFCELK